MRVKFLRDHPGGKGEESYTKGAVAELDDGVAQQLIAAGAARDFPRTQAELDEALTKYYPGDEHRTPRQIAERHAQGVVQLTGDTRANTEAQLGEDDPHVVRKELVESGEKAAVKADEKEVRAETKAAAEKAQAEQTAADEGTHTKAAKAGPSRG